MALTVASVQAFISSVDKNGNGRIDKQGYDLSLFNKAKIGEGQGKGNVASQNNGKSNWWNEADIVYNYLQSLHLDEVGHKMNKDLCNYLSKLDIHIKGLLGRTEWGSSSLYDDIDGIPTDRTELDKFDEAIDQGYDVDPKYKKA